MEHYFIEKQHSADDFFEISQKFLDKIYYFKSCDSIFSKDCVDYGSYVFINTVLKTEQLTGKVLDIGCGYGVIGIVLADNNKTASFVLADVNQTAVDLSIQNAKKNDIKNILSIVKSDCYQNIAGTFDFVVTNPPIRAGKQTLLNILLGAYDKLNDNGSLIFVIKKKHGADSVKNKLAEIFKRVEVLKRDKGYYIFKATK
ncbi:MAG: class I SAM-dependent methyltransferase [Christensenellales bacterium]